jgi:hypothetical protein
MAIHIKAENKGKFTAAAKRAGSTVSGYADRIMAAPKGKYPPALRKEANFAKNARGFKH